MALVTLQTVNSSAGENLQTPHTLLISLFTLSPRVGCSHSNIAATVLALHFMFILFLQMQNKHSFLCRTETTLCIIENISLFELHLETTKDISYHCYS